MIWRAVFRFWILTTIARVSWLCVRLREEKSKKGLEVVLLFCTVRTPFGVRARPVV